MNGDDFQFDGNLTFRGEAAPLLGTLERAYFDKLISAVHEQDGMSAATKLWNACLMNFPESLTWVMEAAASRIGTQGRSLRQIDEVIRVIRRETDRLIHHYWSVDLIPNPCLIESIDKAAEQDRCHPAHVYTRWCAAGDALTEVRFAVWAGRPARSPELFDSKLGMCDLCWRTGVLYPRRARYYCEIHRPLPTNKKYKLAKALLKWRPRATKEIPHPKLFLNSCMISLKDEISTGIHLNDISFRLLSDLLHCDIGTVDPFPINRVNFSQIWPKLPYTSRYLSAHGADIADLSSVIRTLDPVAAPYQERQRLAHLAHLRDQRLFVTMLRICEAWLNALVVRAEHRGRGRRIVDIRDVAD